MNQSIIDKLIAILGDNNVKFNNVSLSAYSYDASPYRATLGKAVVFPTTTEQVSEIVKLCNTEKIAIIPRGAGSNLAGGTMPSGDELIISFTKMNKILEVDKENLTMSVEPGVVTLDIFNKAAQLGFLYPPDPGSLKTCTIGGNIAENSGGLRGLKYGVTSNYILGIEVVLPNGDIMQTGGKLAKDVAGYNLTQLIVGSEGTLGIVTKALLKLIPMPENKKTLSVYFKDLGQAGDTVSNIIGNKIIPATLEILDRKTLEAVENHSQLGLEIDNEAFLLIEQDGKKELVEEDIKKIIEICKSHGGKVSVAETTEEGLQLSGARRNALAALASLAPTTILDDATVPRSEVGTFLREIQRIAKKYDVNICTFGHAGDGNMHPTAATDLSNKKEFRRVEEAFIEIFEVAIDLGGTISGEHGIGRFKAPYLKMKVGEAGFNVMQAIKTAIDPNNIMNPKIIFTTKESEVLRGE